MTDNDKAAKAVKKQIIDEWFLAAHGCKYNRSNPDHLEWAVDFEVGVTVAWNAAIAHAEAEHAERVKALTEVLQNCIDAIETLPPDVLGVGGDGETHWYIRDELIGRAKQALAEHRTEDANE